MKVNADLARAVAVDAANRRMRKAGRTSWSRGDYNEAVRVFNRLCIRLQT